MNENKGFDKELCEFLEKIRYTSVYDDFCERFGKKLREKVCNEELCDFEFGNYIIEAMLTNDIDKVFGSFAGFSAESFLEKFFYVICDKPKYHDEVCKAHFCSVWDGGIKVETECKVNIKTREVFDIEISDIDADLLEVLDEEYIIIDDVKFPACPKDDLEDGDLFTFWYKG